MDKKETEIVRTVQMEDKTIHVHIHLGEDEARRLLLPHVASAFANELRRQTLNPLPITCGGTTTVS